MKVDVITPDKTLFSGGVELVKLPGIDGSFEVMNFHAPIVSILVKGEIKLIDIDQNEQLIEINGGVIEVNDNTCRILVE